MIKVSTLIPTFNASKYLQNALDSVRNQSLKDIEIICINDGSTDNSLEIFRQNAKKDKRIIIIDKPNSGYGDSLNVGLKAANGQYISILEPDDWYDLHFLENTYDHAQKNHLDVIKADFWQYTETNDTNKQYRLFANQRCNAVLSPKESQFIYSLQPSIWSGLYRRQFLIDNHIDFLSTPGASYQDTSFNFKVFSLAKKAMFVNRPYVHYRIDNAGSSINNISKKLPFIDKEYDEIDRFIKTNKLPSYFIRQSDYCRFLTYKWAMEQLDYKSLAKYLAQISKFLNKLLLENSNLLSASQKHELAEMAEHPRIYCFKRTARKIIHRLRNN